jgi:hypothetical protein
MNARQFFDVWPMIVGAASAARASPALLHSHLSHLAAMVGQRHGDDIAADAKRRMRGLLGDSKNCGPR